MTHVIGDAVPLVAPDALAQRRPDGHLVPVFEDVRNALVMLPQFGADGYATTDIFTVREPLLRELEPSSVLEIGAYRGYFLVTALYACDTIERIGWTDDESHAPGSNGMCRDNVVGYCESAGRELPELWWSTQTAHVHVFGQADVVQVDGDHGYESCLTDLIWAASLYPRAIFVDDFTAHDPVAHATRDFVAWRGGWTLDEYETVNGLAVLRKET